MDYQRFYKKLFQPIEKRIGPVDKAGIMAIVGFDCGGPVSLCTVGYGREQFVTYVTCELSMREEQQPTEFGRYEFMMTCDDEDWAHHILTKLGQMSMESAFGHGHTVDVSQIVPRRCPLKGLIIEEFARLTIDRRGYGILRVHGVTRSELKFAMECGSDKLIEKLKSAGIYPNTSLKKRKKLVNLA